MPRSDISPYLVHFTQGDTDDAACARLLGIVRARTLVGSSRNIRGRHVCVCFTEGPLSALANGFVNEMDVSRYRPFGVMFEKRWLFERGGRPVIYQRYDEFDALRESPEHNWRHMTYDPVAANPVDFTWEREWRIRAAELEFDGSSATIVTPNRRWRDTVAGALKASEDIRVWAYAQIMDDAIAEQLREPAWKVVALSDAA